MLTGQLLIVMMCGTVQVYVLSTLAPFITRDLDLSLASFGLLTTVFFAVGAVVSPLAGRWADSLGGSKTMRTLLGISIVSLAGIAASRDLALLLAFSMLGGVASAMVNPATNKVIADAIPEPKQGVVTGVKQSGVQVGAFVSGASLPFVAERIGWHWAALTIVVVPLVAILLPSPAARAARSVRGDSEDKVSLHPGVYVLALYALLMGAAIAATSTYLPLFVHQELSYSPTSAGLVAAAVGLTGIVARIAWGRLASEGDHLGPILVVMAAVAFIAQVLLMVAPEQQGFLAGAVLALGASSAAWNSVAMLGALRLGGPVNAGRASGVVVVGFYLGYVVSPALFGWAVDAAGSFGPGWGGIAVVCIAATVVGAYFVKMGWAAERAAVVVTERA